MSPNHRRSVGAIAFCIVASVAGAQGDRAAEPERRVLSPADYRGVRLLDGPLKRHVDQTKEYYLRIPNDDLLLGFRRRAGLEAPGRELGGWYSADIFHVFGQVLSGLARLYAATGDAACKAKADALLAEWQKCIAGDGFFYFTTKPNAPHYIYDKMVGGLVDMAAYADNKDALESLGRITDWAIKNLDRSNVYAFNAGQGSTEWYTLSENLYRAYLLTGEARYRDFAAVWEYTEYWDLYAKTTDIFGARRDGQRTDAYHAYSHVNALGGAGLAYLVKGERSYLDTLVNAYDYLQRNECFATGGFGPNELLVPHERLREMLGATANTFETQCGAWAAFKMSKHLISLTGDARYGDWVECLAFNGIGATIPMSSYGGVMYYSDYNPFGGAKRNARDGWTCCTGTRPMAVADLCDLIYFHSNDGVFVNLFTPSSAEFHLGRANVTLVQATRFPEEDRTVLTLGASEPTEFTLALRAPGWAAGRGAVSLNGAVVNVTADEKHWLKVRRTWRDGDRLEVTLPMGFRSVPLDDTQAFPTAVAYGPVVLALRSDQGNPGRKIDFSSLAASFVVCPGEPLTFRLRSDHSVLARPFSAYGEGEEYFLYLDPALPNRISFRKVAFEGPWNEGDRFRYSRNVGAACETTFEGTGICWLGYRFDDAGVAEVRIDGAVVATVDQYGPGRDLPFDWRLETLARGKHTIRLTILPDKNPASKDRYINVAGFDVLQGP